MILLPSSTHAIFVTLVIAASLAPNYDCEVTVSCQNIHPYNSTNLAISTESPAHSNDADILDLDDDTMAKPNKRTMSNSPAYKEHYKEHYKENIVPASSTDMIAMARKIAEKKEAIEICKHENVSTIEIRDGIKCIKSVLISNKTRTCVINTTIPIFLTAGNNLVKQAKETNIYIAGNVVGFVFLVILLTTYSSFKELQTSYGICIVILSIIVIVKNVIQVFAYISEKKSEVCKVVGISSHWLHLSMFCWMASIACDLLVTFSRVRLPSTAAQKRKLKKYMIFSFSAPTSVVLVCLIIDLSYTQLYGLRGICFISQRTSNIASFAVPVTVALLFNMICIGWTMYFIRSASKASKSLSKHDNGKPSISFTIMAIKLSLLLGIGWVIGYIGVIMQSSVLLYTFLILDSFQGMLIYFAFCCNQKVFSFYKNSLSAHLRRIRISPSSSRREINEIGI